MKNSLSVIKIGGKVAEERSELKTFLKGFSGIRGPKILVHGGGVTATKIGERLGIEPKFIDGRRITDLQTMELVTMVYGGLINKQIVAELQAINVNAVGLTGADLNVIVSEKRKPEPVDFGYVGDIRTVDAAILEELLNKDMVPVLAPLTHDGKGTMLNTNADAIASFTAAAMSRRFDTELIFCFEKDGVISGDTVVPKLNKSDYSELKTSGVITDGMIPKLDLGFAALENGVQKVRITSYKTIQAPGKGTQLSNG